MQEALEYPGPSMLSSICYSLDGASKKEEEAELKYLGLRPSIRVFLELSHDWMCMSGR